MYNDEYWFETMKRRQPLNCEVERLISVAKGFYLSELKYNAEGDNKAIINLKDYDLLYFVKEAKRPFGNKDIEASICFNLGWDWKRDLVNWTMPKWVRKEAKNVYRAVIEELEKGND